MADVRLNNVIKRFGSVTAVNQVSLNIASGEFISLLGPSGCGKTTTLRLIAGLEVPDGGSIHIGERDVTHLSPRDRDIAMVFQDYALYPHMSILDNIGYPLKVRGVARDELVSRVQEVSDRLQIGTLLERRPGQLSGGQQQRASVARAVVYHSQVFLFDEPLSNLDAKLRVEARAFLKRLQQEIGVTAIYVTHDQAEAMALSNRIAVMREGVIMQLGTPLEVYQRPSNMFVAAFMGSPPMNLIPCRVDLGQGNLLFDGDIKLDITPLREKLTAELRDGAQLSLGIRPEHITLSTEPTPTAIPAKVYVIEPLGGEILVITEVGETLASVKLFQDEPPPLPESIWLDLNMDRVFLYNADGDLIQ
jgi:multiple sugar transport system ATP-binding protein